MKSPDLFNEKVTGWDARQSWIWQLNKRVDLYLDMDWRQPQLKFERLKDMFNFGYPALNTEQQQNCSQQIDIIENLLWSDKNQDGTFKTPAQVQKDKTIAYSYMDKTFRMIHKAVWDKGLWIPLYDKKDPAHAIMDMGI